MYRSLNMTPCVETSNKLLEFIYFQRRVLAVFYEEAKKVIFKRDLFPNGLTKYLFAFRYLIEIHIIANKYI